ncbi:MAG TPA: helix-turn-helix domain-containing protein [Euzebyales bacterium]|nr:helix-turn-helix domain-containing protein [Euzebyales bacterium]
MNGAYGDHVGVEARLLVGGHTMVFRGRTPAAAGEHATPVWKIVVPLAGPIEWQVGRQARRQAAGVIYPPQLAHRARSDAAYLAVHLDAWHLGLGPARHGAVALNHATAQRLRMLWSDVDADDLDEAARETVIQLRRQEVLAPPVPIDPRVGVVLDTLPDADRVQELAGEVGLSASRLRVLVRDVTGAPLVRLRMWERLRMSVAGLVDSPIATAAVDAGFADQPHLTRTATRLIGHTPADIAATLR